MIRRSAITHRFVDLIPDVVDAGVLYISIPYATAVHQCCCGCGLEVVTPLGPTDWSVTYDGETATLSPSIGNWSYPCQAHYFIDHDRVRWAPRWSREQIEAARARDRSAKMNRHATAAAATELQSPRSTTPQVATTARRRRVSAWLRRLIESGHRR